MRKKITSTWNLIEKWLFFLPTQKAIRKYFDFSFNEWWQMLKPFQTKSQFNQMEKSQSGVDINLFST